MDDLTIQDFRQFKFEKIFKGKKKNFIREFVVKKKNISNFETVIKFINFKSPKEIESKSTQKFLGIYGQ